MAAGRALGRLVAALHHDQRRAPAGVAAGVPAQPGARRGVPGRGADAVGRDVPDRGGAGGARGPRGRRGVPPDRLPRAPTGRRCGSRRPGPSCCPPAWRWWRTRTTRGTRGCSASTVRTPVFGVAVPVLAHPLAEPDKGSGIAMVCTFGDLTDVTWWRELDLPTAGDHRTERAAACRAARRGARARRTRNWRGRPCSRPGRGWSSCCGSSGDLDGEPRPVTRPVKFYERGDKPLEIVTSGQWYIRNGGRTHASVRDTARPGRELTWHPAHMRVRYENWVAGLAGRLADLAAAVLRRAVPGLVPGRRGRRAGLRVADRAAAESRCRSTRSPSPRPGTRSRSAARRAGSSATPT